jgi:hypothetical protein
VGLWSLPTHSVSLAWGAAQPIRRARDIASSP